MKPWNGLKIGIKIDDYEKKKNRKYLKIFFTSSTFLEYEMGFEIQVKENEDIEVFSENSKKKKYVFFKLKKNTFLRLKKISLNFFIYKTQGNVWKYPSNSIVLKLENT